MTADRPLDIAVATPADRLAVRRLIDAAALSVTDVALPECLAAGTVLLARRRRPVGTIVLTPPARDRDDTPLDGGAHIVAIAVRRAQRDQGIGTALIDAAADRWMPLTARYAPRVRAFWASVGFDATRTEDGRYWGSLASATSV